MPKKFSVVVRPSRRKKLVPAPGTATVRKPTPAERELGLKSGDQVFVTRSSRAAARQVNRAAEKNKPGTIGAISRTEISPVMSFERNQQVPRSKRSRSAKPRRLAKSRSER